MDRTSTAILVKGIKLDKQYNNIINYTESQMVTLCETNKVYKATNCSFLRNDRAMELEVPYATAMQANYLAFKNNDYGNKWYFAFIDKVEYVSEKTSRIHYTIDECSTWRDYWQIKQSFVVREHVNDDTVGLHTVPEGLDLGDYQIVDMRYASLYEPSTTELAFCPTFCVTKYPSSFDRLADNGRIKGDLGYIGGVFSSLKFFAVTTYAGAEAVIKAYEEDSGVSTDAILNIYMIPRNCVNTSVTLPSHYHPTGLDIWLYPLYNYFESDSNNIQEPAVLAGNYTPVNKKLLTWPFSYFYATNNEGETIDYRWEDFPIETITVGNVSNTARTATYTKYIVPSTSISAKLVFDKYKDHTSTTEYPTKMPVYGISFGKIPVCAWTTDVYTNWLTQNGTNVALDFLKAGTGIAIGAVAGMASGGLGALAIGGAVATGANTIFGAVQKDTEMSKIPPQSHGDINTGDYNFAFNRNIIQFYMMSIRPEYSAIIDKYFSLKGYKVNTVKTPNETGRRNWNYVQIADSEAIGFTKTGSNVISVPSESMDIINNVYRKGVTIWHNHDNIGDYSLNNDIIVTT